MRVLIVEDEPKLASLLRKGLTAQGFAADVATQGDEAMYMATATAYDAITLDVMLPDINGKEVCQRVRSDSNMEEVRILCISGMIEEDKIAELKLAGADDFLHKPFDLEELIDRMCAQLEMEPASASA